ncbi:protein THYLAKOID FORMATION 1, chloroplastic [Selaginella moellendorffii]|uniref:protein THYLAKOID FORMATION 1, chloroplastic n=1 Tax=Selaginella moellendorffii TaxID=88036 RepID=UPI000D1C9CE0|nr:protein THYLAKOID FORMATION 1, chloroplastic [Selaginella moellendorffii]|eukprot:XP_002985488.2 protein THYLAKOID FORMATION 1, chloroplastic [Selaginella moellendorffii]
MAALSAVTTFHRCDQAPAINLGVARCVTLARIVRWRFLGCDAASSSSQRIFHPPHCSIACAAAVAAGDVPTVADTKSAFLKAFRKPIPSIYNNVLQELLVQQHLMRYNATYKYDAVFALGFVTVYDQLMDGYPNAQDSEAIFKAYIEALGEDPDQYRKDAKKLEEWASSQTASSLASFNSGDGDVEEVLKDIAQRAAGKTSFHYSRFFAVGLFRLVERANASDPAVLEKLCNALNVSKMSVDRDLDVYRNLLTKLSQAKDLLKEYIDREKKKSAEREASKTSEPVNK